MKKILKGLLMIYISLISVKLTAQTKQVVYPEVGKPMPADFILRNIQYFPKKEATMADFKGKWLLLDFWTIHCSSCIASFPRINEEMKEFKSKVQFMLVGAPQSDDPKGVIEDKYKSIRGRAGLQLPCAFDSVLFKRYDLDKVPYVILIDPQGIVKAIALHFDRTDIADFLNGNIPPAGKLFKTYRKNEKRVEIPFDMDKLLLIGGNGGSDTDFQYRSLLKKCGTDYSLLAALNMADIKDDNSGIYQAIQAPIISLYKTAYIGQSFWTEYFPKDSLLHTRIWPRPILKIKDTTLFNDNYMDSTVTYCYSVKVPKVKASKAYLMQTMQNDLKNYFGYQVQIEEREMPCLKLVVSDKTKLKLWEKGDTTKSKKLGPLKWHWVNFPIDQILIHLNDLGRQMKLPAIDYTGIKDTLNLDVDCYWNDLNDVRKTLQRNGMDLVRGTKKMKVLVISDPKPEETALLSN